MPRVDSKFRAAVVQANRQVAVSKQAAVASEVQPWLPSDTRRIRRGTKSSLRWSQTPAKDVVQDRLELSVEAQAKEHPQSGRRYQDAELRQAGDTLSQVLGELERRGLADHPRAKSLAALRDRLAPSIPQVGTFIPAQTMRSWQDLKGQVADLKEVLLYALQSKQGREVRKRLLLDQAKDAHSKGHLRQERRILCQVLVCQPQEPEANARMAKLFLAAGRYELAEPHARTAAAARPNSPDSHVSVGEVEYHKGNQREAVACFGRALRLNPDHSDANAWLGILAYQGQRPAEAQRFLERAIACDGNHAVARFYLAQLSLAHGDSLRAEYQLGMVRQLVPQANLERFDSPDPALLAASAASSYSGWTLPR